MTQPENPKPPVPAGFPLELRIVQNEGKITQLIVDMQRLDDTLKEHRQRLHDLANAMMPLTLTHKTLASVADKVENLALDVAAFKGRALGALGVVSVLIPLATAFIIKAMGH